MAVAIGGGNGDVADAGAVASIAGGAAAGALGSAAGIGRAGPDALGPAIGAATTPAATGGRAASLRLARDGRAGRIGAATDASSVPHAGQASRPAGSA